MQDPSAKWTIFCAVEVIHDFISKKFNGWLVHAFPCFSRLSHFFPHNHRLGYLMYLLLLIRDLSLKTLNFLCFWVPWNEGFSDLRTCQDWALAAKDPSSLSHFFFGHHWGLPEVPGPGDLQHVHWRVGWPMAQIITDLVAFFPPTLMKCERAYTHTLTHTKIDR